MTSLSISGCIAYWAARKPDSTAIRIDDASITWHDLEQRTNRLARYFSAVGVGLGDFVVIALPNSIAFFEAAIATWKVGGTPMPISWRAPEFERLAQVELVSPRLVIGWEGQVLPREIATLDLTLDVTASISEDPLPDCVSPNWKALASGGSTGRPKIIVSRVPGLFDPNVPEFMMACNEVILAAGPLYHNASFMFSARALFCGIQVVILPKFDAEAALAAIEKYHVNWAVFVPTMMHRIWQMPEEIRSKYSTKSLRIVFHTGSSCAIWLKQAWIDWLGANVIQEGYGGTEGCGGHWITGTEWLDHKGSVGKTLPEFEVRILNAEGDELPNGEIGDIYSRPLEGPGTSHYYVGADSHRTRDGFEWIGDIGYLDAEGYLYLADRRTDLIVSGGANIFPAEVEAMIDSFPGVRTSAVVGLPDDEMGAISHAIVEAEQSLDLAGLRQHLALNLSRYKLPRTFEIVTEPLRDEAGKLRRSQLRSERIGQVT